MKALLLLVLGMTVCMHAPVLARTWTNSEGLAIVADYVSSDGTKVILRMNGKEVPYPLSKLSEADREWIAKQADTSSTVPEQGTAGALTGVRKGLPITARLFPDLDGYCKERTRRKVADAFENGAYSDEKQRHDDPKEWMRRDANQDRYDLYVPSSYDGSEAYGLYLHISPGDGGGIPVQWHPVFDERKLIAAAAHGVGNTQQMLRRVTLSMDAMHTMMQDYKIDPKRCVVGGLSGGGHMAMLTGAMFPEYFAGAVSHAAQSYLPTDPRRGSHFPGIEIRDFKRSPRKEIKWVVISGDKDQNYSEIQLTSKVWAAERLDYQFIDVPGMGHTNAKPEDLAKALDWILK
jgi:predicted peptidase